MSQDQQIAEFITAQLKQSAVAMEKTALINSLAALQWLDAIVAGKVAITKKIEDAQKQD